MSGRDQIVTDPLFTGMTRPAMMMGVTFSFFIINMTASAIFFLALNNFLALLVAIPIHGAGMLACARDPRFFDLVMLRFQRCPPVRNRRLWHANSYMP